MRSTSASPMPSWRTRLRCAGFTFCDRIATSRTLSMPRTISMTVRLTRLTSPSAESSALKVEHGGRLALSELAGDRAPLLRRRAR